MKQGAGGSQRYGDENTKEEREKDLQQEKIDNISRECRSLYFQLVTFLSKYKKTLRSPSSADILAEVREDYETVFFAKEKEAVEAGVWEDCEFFFDNLYLAMEREFEEL